jgi:hypothetical protein
MKSIGIAKSIPLSDLIDILVKLERKGIQYIDVEFLREEKGDRLRIYKGKKKPRLDKSSKPLTDARLRSLLNHV